ncbi:serine/threonine-protein kinase/endoribonuclease IRE1 isoform X2 [Oryza brachyantha]|uniref:serine/threonine-protein kinase/endoribonuclease IRE1 isoform X2 n=1 Tax=Oryza brachyantha TaxID=4533 RepID=UPI001ADAB177|nr:serine/threonine-protein kinase/endoribonuclease IRE1 isoform X2 [Oryza brachyantha]
MRSLRRVLLPLVLLAGLAFRGVRFDDAASAAAQGPDLLIPLPSSSPQPALALPGDGDEGASTEIIAAPWPGRHGLFTPPRGSPRPASALVQESAAIGSQLHFYDNGTIQLVDLLSKSPRWQFSTGPPLSKHITTSKPDLNYFIYLDGSETSDLIEVHNGSGVRLPWKLEEFIAETPYIRDSFVTIGSKVSTTFVVDADSGEIIYKHSLPAALNEVGAPLVEEIPSKLDAARSGTRANIIVVVRTDYSVSASDLGEHLFNWTRTSFIANYYMRYGHQDMLDQSSCMRGNIPCIRTEGLPLKLPLPASSSDNAIVLKSANEVTTRDDADVDALELILTSSKLSQTAGKSNVALDNALNQTADSALDHLVSADAELNKWFTKFLYRWLFPTFLVLVIMACLVGLTDAGKSCWQFVIRFVKPFMHEDMEHRGKLEGASKRRKTRKKDGLPASDKDNSGTVGSIEAPSSEVHESTNTELPDGLNGRQIGKLRVYSKEIGKGSNGTVVFEGSYGGREVAVKRLLCSHNDIASKEIENLIASDQDPNIVRMYGFEQDNDFVYIALERCCCSLAELIQQHSLPSFSNTKGLDIELWRWDGLPSAQLLKLMRDVVAGMVHLHSLGIIHRDLKPQNVLISKERPLRAKLSDMGISKRLQEDMTSLSHHGTGFGSSGWQAPEQLRHGRQTRAVDLFSLGCLIFYCITKGKHPFGEYYERDRNIINNQVDFFIVDHIPEAVHLISQLLHPRPEERPTAVYVMNHPFFWSPELCLSFLRDTSDRIEKISETDLIDDLEGINAEAFGKNWGEKLDAALLADMGRYRKYSFESTRDLLRLIRNKSGHYREFSDDLKVVQSPSMMLWKGVGILQPWHCSF